MIPLVSSLRTLILVSIWATSSLPKHVSTAQLPTHPFFLEENCDKEHAGTYIRNSTYHTNLNSVLSDLIFHASVAAFYNSSAGLEDGSDTAYGKYFCRGDISVQFCHDCIKEAAQNVSVGGVCFGVKEGTIYYKECTLLYSNRSRFGVKEESVGGYFYSDVNVSHPVKFNQVLGNVTRVILKKAAYSNSTAPPPETPNSPPAAPNPTLGSTTPEPLSVGQIPEIIISCVIAGIFLLILALWLFLFKKKAEEVSEDIRDIIFVDSWQMDFNTIRAATQNFAADRKLGQGGFGKVYKGTLENGQDIAVKRLSTNSGQGIATFKTEVLVVAKLQHRNLVKLLGFCISGLEKILVYEFLPNSSLDKILFDRIKRTTLSWEIRFKIISGIAKGLLYLHEDSRLRIVHRDLKSSNILLDAAMNPKIADFGLAKLFGADQTQDATNTIVGTYGYMAPEYVLTGHYSMKSDVYAFGIITLEVVSGQRNKYLNYPQVEEPLLHRAWRLWIESEGLSLVDESLGNNYASEDVMKCIHIALLCIQENVAKRPNMTFVVAALGGQSIQLPLPAPPNFFGTFDTASTVNSGQSATIYGISDISEVDPR